VKVKIPCFNGESNHGRENIFANQVSDKELKSIIHLKHSTIQQQRNKKLNSEEFTDGEIPRWQLEGGSRK
jgi:hypothetical protein